jgi:uncharacterized membrane protein YeaQ/YmgE (transglycosylase-associated protein family)
MELSDEIDLMDLDQLESLLMNLEDEDVAMQEEYIGPARECVYVTEGGVYNLMDGPTALAVQIEDIWDLDQSIAFNLCRQSITRDVFVDTPYWDVFNSHCDAVEAFAFHLEDSKCTEFTSPIIEPAVAVVAPAVTKGIQIPANGGISLNYGVAGSYCRGTGGEKRMRVTLMCDPDEPDLAYIDQRFYKAQCTMELRYASRSGCPVDNWMELQNEDLVHEIAKDIENVGNKAKTLEATPDKKTRMQDFVHKNPVICGLVLIPTGALFAFVGWYMLDAILLLTTFATVFGVCAFSALQLTEVAYKNVDSEPGWLIGTVLIASLLAGLSATCCMKKIRDYGTTLLAGVGGFVGGQALCHMFGVTNNIVHWALIAVCIIGAVILVRFVEFMLILAITSIGGSYMLVRGLSFFIGGFPDEALVKDAVAQGIKPWAQFKYFWPYAGAIVGLSILAFMVQLKVTGTWKKKESEGERSEVAN